jgi:DNA-binding response OmpR family regulator
MAALARVLVVDDDPSVAEVLSDFFEEEGYDVRTAENGRVALDLFDAWRPNVVLLDLRMPGLSGEDVFLRLRSMSPRAAVIFVTGADDEIVARRLLRGGATDYVQKPIDLDYCALAVLLSIARGTTPPAGATPEPMVQSLYRLVRCACSTSRRRRCARPWSSSRTRRCATRSRTRPSAPRATSRCCGATSTASRRPRSRVVTAR